VVTRWTGSGTHQVEFMRVAATGNQVTVTGITINRISGGKIAESWTNDDTFGHEAADRSRSRAGTSQNLALLATS
jgi:predicted ester cyclase